MNYQSASLYHRTSASAPNFLISRLRTGLARYPGHHPVPVYFRADDVGVISASFIRLLELFAAHRLPLCLAVVPAWLTAARWQEINRLCRPGEPLWCWHQHGWTHHSHQRTGKKSEFGPERSSTAVLRDLLNGRHRLQQLLGPVFTPIFTPPWNRCSDQTLALLGTTGFLAVSRDRHAPPMPPGSVPDLPVHVDLHTRREQRAEDCLDNLGEELHQAARNGRIGIMIHHQRMNDHAFDLLDRLLGLISRTPGLIPTHFGRML